MSKYIPPATGGGYPVVAVGGRVVRATKTEEVGPLVFSLKADAEAEATGRAVVECIRKACLERDLDDVTTLHMLFPSVVSRVPEFHVLIAELSEGALDVLAKVLLIPQKRRGRPREDQFEMVALIEHVMHEQDFEDAIDAIRWLHEHKAELVATDLQSVRTLQNKHSALGEYFRLWSSSMYVPPELLTQLPPCAPGMEHPPELVEASRYPPPDGSPWPTAIQIDVRPPRKKER